MSRPAQYVNGLVGPLSSEEYMSLVIEKNTTVDGCRFLGDGSMFTRVFLDMWTPGDAVEGEFYPVPFEEMDNGTWFRIEADGGEEIISRASFLERYPETKWWFDPEDIGVDLHEVMDEAENS